MSSQSKKNGFSLIELVVSISLIVILSAMSLAGYYEFTQRQAVMNDARNLATELREVQAMAKNLVYPSTCVGLRGYRIRSTSVNDKWQYVNVSAECTTGTYTVAQNKKILEESVLPESLNVMFAAGSGGIDPATTYDLVNDNNEYQVSVITNPVGNISISGITNAPEPTATQTSTPTPTPTVTVTPTPTSTPTPTPVACLSGYYCMTAKNDATCTSSAGYVENCLGGNCCAPNPFTQGGELIQL